MNTRIYFAYLILMTAGVSGGACSLATSGPAIKQYDQPRSALLVLDMQTDFIGKDARMPIAPGRDEQLIKNVNASIRAAEKRGDLVVYVGNEFSPWSPANLFRNFAAIRGRPGAELDKRLYRMDAPYFAKDFPDAFSNKRLGEYLRRNRVNRLTIVGVFADQCVLHTARGARNRDYQVRVFTDAVAAGDDANYRHALKKYAEYGITPERLNGQ